MIWISLAYDRHSAAFSVLGPENTENGRLMWTRLDIDFVSTASILVYMFKTLMFCSAVESSSMCVFCHECDDFVYDSGLERVRIYGTATTPPSKKRKSEDAEDEESFLKLNSTKRLCGPTGIRGLYNLGQTCYQNVVIQSLLHNPLLTSYFLSDGHKAHSCDLISCIGCAVSEAFAECHNTEKNEGYGAVGLLLSTWQTSNVSSIIMRCSGRTLMFTCTATRRISAARCS